MSSPPDLDKLGLATTLAKARRSYYEGGIPIGAALVYHSGDTPVVLGCAHNQRIQKSSPTLHAEIAALEDAGHQKAAVYRHSTMVGSSPISLGMLGGLHRRVAPKKGRKRMLFTNASDCDDTSLLFRLPIVCGPDEVFSSMRESEAAERDKGEAFGTFEPLCQPG
ncbi:hypothetical protein EV363DRAFT_1295623 [Boletus edulis]|nr:hypothetical protein EV363DRAFT_1295623 [Boletus edulis]